MADDLSLSNNFYDVIIVGGGPAGSSCALSLSHSGLKALLIDKAKFPRDKICGDALSLDVINQLPMISQAVATDFNSHTEKLPSSGVRIFSPDLTCIDLPFVHKGTQKNGYVMRRVDFDNILLQKVKETRAIHVLEGCEVLTAVRQRNEVVVSTSRGNYRCAMVVGADGANSTVGKLVGRKFIERDHYSAGLRVYYEGVNSFHAQNYIELYFFNDILPGYLWVFPMAGNRANVGIGVLSSVIKNKRMNLRQTIQRLITTHPALRDRFANARPLESIKGHGLPLGSRKRSISGERVLLLGDAAGLIDPFTGEGIGNAIRSGRVAAEHIQQCFEQKTFSAQFNKQYDREIYRRMWKEFEISCALQRLCRYPSLFNFVFRKATSSEYWHNFLTQSLADVDQKKQFKNPIFYYRLLFG